ncbi:hypothetical protein NEHOM01_0210 [Nematocida homosporus]|uniref:uncharacterized protein n=1 Tax=Nematocida homosporus TaxID=1912981 RepID=UPI00221E6BFE|nr:uncharacterized protein NEHOM01_0210 [Nematocida homosporus]KAI5184535.1 hypothetical protein NEHOM01_0210 [Nematocida homosporus]
MKKKTPRVKEKNNTSTKKLQQQFTPEGALITNAALNSYVQEFMKDLTEDTYKILEEQTQTTYTELIPPTQPESILLQSSPSLLSLLVSSLISTATPPTTTDEEKKRRVLQRSEAFSFLNSALLDLLSSDLITPEDTEENSTHRLAEIQLYQNLLQTIETTNNHNKQQILAQRKPHLAQLFYSSLLEAIDTNLESVYTKKYKPKKKKKEDDLTYTTEIEELLDKRNKLKQACNSLPDQLQDLHTPDLALYSPFSHLDQKEADLLFRLLPAYFHDPQNSPLTTPHSTPQPNPN